MTTKATTAGAGSPAKGGAAVADLSYSAAGSELDRIIEEFEAGVIDVDRLVERLERATAIVDELDRRLRRTRIQVEELVPRLEAIGRPDGGGAAGYQPDEDDEEALIVEVETSETIEIVAEETGPTGLF